MDKIKNEMIKYGQLLYQKNLLVSFDGNLSEKHEDVVYITPTQCAKRDLSTIEMAQLKINGQIVKGNPSSESSLHLTIYKLVPETKAVIHAHPPTAIAWSISHPHLTELPCDSMSEIILSVGRIPIIPYVRPGTDGWYEAIKDVRGDSKVMIMQGHGAISFGDSLEEAFHGMERLEAICEILYKAKTLGGIHSLPITEIEALREIRKKLGNKTL